MAARSAPARAAQTDRRVLALPDEQHAIDLVDLDELDLHALAPCRRQVLADVVGADRKLAVPSIDQNGELHARRPAELEERVDRGADRAARVEHVVDQDDRHPLDGNGMLVARTTGWRSGGLPPSRTCTSSRWNVMSSAPSGSSTPLRSATSRFRRDASGTPRVWMPTSAMLLEPWAHPGRRGALDDLMGDPRKRLRDRLGVEERASRSARSGTCVVIVLLSGLTGPG